MFQSNKFFFTNFTWFHFNIPIDHFIWTNVSFTKCNSQSKLSRLIFFPKIFSKRNFVSKRKEECRYETKDDQLANKSMLLLKIIPNYFLHQLNQVKLTWTILDKNQQYIIERIHSTINNNNKQIFSTQIQHQLSIPLYYLHLKCSIDRNLIFIINKPSDDDWERPKSTNKFIWIFNFERILFWTTFLLFDSFCQFLIEIVHPFVLFLPLLQLFFFQFQRKKKKAFRLRKFLHLVHHRDFYSKRDQIVMKIKQSFTSNMSMTHTHKSYA